MFYICDRNISLTIVSKNQNEIINFVEDWVKRVYRRIAAKKQI